LFGINIALFISSETQKRRGGPGWLLGTGTEVPFASVVPESTFCRFEEGKSNKVQNFLAALFALAVRTLSAKLHEKQFRKIES